MSKFFLKQKNKIISSSVVIIAITTFLLTAYAVPNSELKNDNNIQNLSKNENIENDDVINTKLISSDTSNKINPIFSIGLITVNLPDNLASSFLKLPNTIPDYLLDTAYTFIKDLIIKNMINPIPVGDPDNPPTSIKEIQVIKVDNIIGNMTLNVVINNYFTEVGFTKEGEFNIPISGFKKISETTFTKGNVQMDPTYVDFLAQDFVTDTTLLAKTLFPLVSFSPEGTDWTNIIFNKIRPLNNEGRIKVFLSFHKYYNKLGFLTDNKITEYKAIEIQFSGFRIVDGITSLPNTIVAPKIYLNTLPSNIDNSSIKNIIIENIKNKPDGFNVNNIILPSNNQIIYDNKNGNITLNPNLNLFYNSEYLLVNSISEWNILPITISGFKKTGPTVINTLPISTGLNNLAPYQVTKEQNNFFKKILLDRISNKPNGFNIANILLSDNNIINNKLGTIELFGKINYFYDEKSNIITPDNGKFIEFQITLLDFKQILPTNNLTSFQVDKIIGGSTLPSNVKKEFLNSIIKNNFYEIFSNIPQEFNTNTNIVKINIINPNNIDGSLSAEIDINCFFDSKYQYINNTNIFSSTIKFTNFAKAIPTSFNKENSLPNLSNVVPSSVDNDFLVNKILFPNQNIIFNNLPSGLLPSNFIDPVIHKNTKNDLEGTLIIDIKLNNFYNDSGIIVNDGIEKLECHNITIKGFRKVKPTIFYGAVILYDDFTSNLLPQLVNEENILKIIYNNLDIFFSSYPKEIKIYNPIINWYKNIEGQININVDVINYYSSTGTLITQPKNNSVTISGFKKVKPTEFASEFTLPENTYNDFLPSSMTVQQITSLLYSYQNVIFKNLPDGFDISNINLLFEENYYSNIDGTLIAVMNIDNYYDEDGILKNDSNRPLYKKITITGFKKVFATVIKDSFIIPNDLASNTLATSISEEQLKTIVWNYRNQFIDNLPLSLTQSDIYLAYNIAIQNNKEGSIRIKIELYQYYKKKTGELVFPEQGKKDPLVKLVTISGFKIIDGATEIADVDVTGQFQETLYPFEVTTDDMISLLFSTDSISNIPNDFTSSNIIIDNSSKTINNINGSFKINIKLNKYYNDNSELIDKIGDGKIVEFKGFAKVVPTSINSIINIQDDDYLKNNLASDFNEGFFLSYIRDNWKLKNIIVGVPPGFDTNNIINFKFLSPPDNKTGQIFGSVTINNFFNKNGNHQNNTGVLLEGEILFQGFKTISQTHAKQEIIFNFDNTLAEECDEVKIREEIYLNKDLIYTNLPKISIDDLLVSINNYDNKLGTLSVNLKLRKYYDQFSNLVETTDPDKFLTSGLLILGFKKVEKTEIITSSRVLGFNNKLPSDIPESDIKSYIWNNHTLFILNIPEGFTISNMSVIKINNDNKNGNISIRITLNKFYNSNSNLITGGILSQEVLLSGFKTSTPTTVVSNINLIDLLNTPVDSVNIEALKLLVLEKQDQIFTNLVGGILQYPDFNINIVQRSNKNGTIQINLQLNKYYNEDGIQITNPSLSSNLLIKGFKSIPPTEIISKVNVSDAEGTQDWSNILPSEVIENPSLMNNLILSLQKSIFVNLPLDWNTSENNPDIISIIPNKNENNKANLTGNIFLTISIKNYYDQSSNIQNNNNLKVSKIEISGFKTNITTTALSNYSIKDLNLPSLENKILIPEMITNQDLRKILENLKKQIFTGLPPSIHADIENDNNILLPTIIKRDNLNGEIEAIIKLKSYYNESGILMEDSKFSKNIKISGFTKVQPTTINNVELSQKEDFIIIDIGDQNVSPISFENLSSEELTERMQSLKETMTSQIINNTIVSLDGNVGVPIKTIIESIVYNKNSANISDGTIRVSAKLKNFILSNGKIVDNLTDFNFKISGYQISNTLQRSSNDYLLQYSLIGISVLVGCILLFTMVKFIKTFKKKRSL